MSTTTPLSSTEFATLMQELGLHPATPLAVATSGGADSMALLRLLAQWGRDVTALTYDHGLRAEARHEAAQVASWCSDIGVSHHILTWEGDRPTADIQQAAREARYHDLEAWCVAHDRQHLLLAHHQSDQAETVLMRLIRGSGVNGLAAMKKTSPALTANEGLWLHRPLLSVPKSRLVATLEDMKQPWIEDPSNVDERYLRARVRVMLAQFEDEGLNPLRLSLTADRMARVRDYFEDVLAHWFKTHTILDDAGFLCLPLSVLHNEHPELRGRLVSRFLQALSGQRHPPSFDAVLRVDEALQGDVTGLTSYGCRLWCEGERLYVAREYDKIKDETTLDVDGHVYWDGRFHIYRHGGDGTLNVSALGEEGWLALLERFDEAREKDIPHPVRLTLPAFWRDGKIVAVPHLGYASSNVGDMEYRFEPRRPII